MCVYWLVFENRVSGNFFVVEKCIILHRVASALGDKEATTLFVIKSEGYGLVIECSLAKFPILDTSH